MNTVIIEILTKSEAENQSLKTDTEYIALIGSEYKLDFKIDCNQSDFDKYVVLLRYDNNAGSRKQGIDFFQDLITQIIEKIYDAQEIKPVNNGFLHLRLVTTPKEIAQLPFEMALTPLSLENVTTRIPFFIHPGKKTIFTREVRQPLFQQYKWPFKPRILFAWAQPKATVPKDEHLSAFIRVLRPWAMPIKTSVEPIPDIGSLITLLPDATLKSLKDMINNAFNDNKPYTHVHILAHGSRSTSIEGTQYLLLINNDNPAERSYYANGSELSNALIVEKNGQHFPPQVVSLIACDSGNVGNPINPTGSIAQTLHQNGIPCVFASQFPLTQEGSVNFVTALYSQLLESSDPRLALYDTRMKLASDKAHDWASLVAYARFPSDIDEQMNDIYLKICLLFMKTANGLADHVIKHLNNIKEDKKVAAFTEVNLRLDSSINNLTILLNSTANDKINKERYAEHYGLIGSAFKRKAEHVFRVSSLNNELPTEIKEVSKTALNHAKGYYEKGYRCLNSHWNGTQYLSLAVWLNDSIGDEEKEIWTFCKVMAASDEQYAVGDDEGKAWAYGTLAELFLLKPFIMELKEIEKIESFNIAKDYLTKLTALKNQQFPIESTTRQFVRYINWWPQMSGSKVMDELKSIAISLRNLLPEL